MEKRFFKIGELNAIMEKCRSYAFRVNKSLDFEKRRNGTWRIRQIIYFSAVTEMIVKFGIRITPAELLDAPFPSFPTPKAFSVCEIDKKLSYVMLDFTRTSYPLHQHFY